MARSSGDGSGMTRAQTFTTLLVTILSILTLYEVHERSHGYQFKTRPDIAKNIMDVSSEITFTSRTYTCRAEQNAEYSGTVLKSGADHLQKTAAQCCQACSSTPGCSVWVWCAWLQGCGPDRKYRECWLKSSTVNEVLLMEGFATPNVGWMSGSAFEPSIRAAIEAKEEERLSDLRENKSLPLVFFDISIKGVPIGRIEMVLFQDRAPLAAENFRALCTGEMGIAPAGSQGAGKPYHFKGAYFYRIVDRFICQSGAATDSVFGGTFRDDPGGLALKHDRKGLLSMANSGPDSNSCHFSFLMAPAPHLDGKYVIFGEVVTGMEVVYKINELARGKKDNVAGVEEQALISNSGQLRA